MQNNTQIDFTSQLKNTWLHISFSDDISSELGNVIPYPHYHYMRNNKLVYCWLLDGFFDTLKGVQFLNDIIARFKITFETSQYLKHSVDNESTICPLKLKQFQGLKSRAIQRIQQTHRFDGTKDFIFYSIKFYAEDLIKEKTIFTENELIDFALINFIDKAKDRSTLKAKCKNIYRYYLDKNFECDKSKYIKKDVEEVMATRVEHANKLSLRNEEIAKQKIYNAQRLIKYFGNQDGKLSLRAIERESGCSINTVRKHYISWDKI
ncbi:hypothetical protein ACOTVR_08770 [Aliarcobacter butzleri]